MLLCRRAAGAALLSQKKFKPVIYPYPPGKLKIFSEIFMISFVKRGPVKIETPVEWLLSHTGLSQYIICKQIIIWYHVFVV
jgi:hypothetical protein